MIKNHLTLVSHTNGVVIVEESGCIIDLDYNVLSSICEITDLGNTYTIKDCDEVIKLRNQVQGLANELTTRGERISQLNDEIENLKVLNKRDVVRYKNCIAEKNQEIETLKAQADKDEEERKELCKRIDYFENKFDYFENKLVISRDRATRLEEVNVKLNETIVDKDNSIKHLNKVIEEKTNSLIKLENIEDTLNATVKANEELNIQLSCAKEDIDNLNKQFAEKTSLLAKRTHDLRVFKQALYDIRLYIQPNKEYKLDSEWLTIHNSISSNFFIRFKDSASVAKAIEDCRYCISLKDVLDKYENDIVDFDFSYIDVYYINETSANVVRKFNYDNFTIVCQDVRTANTINTLLNCSNISVDDVVEKFKDKIVNYNIH